MHSFTIPENRPIGFDDRIMPCSERHGMFLMVSPLANKLQLYRSENGVRRAIL